MATLAAALALVALGGAVRATDSGLACPDWPRCHGLWIPGADLHMWLEHSHRLAAGLVGLLVAVLLTWALRTFRERRDIVWTLVVAAVLVVLQSLLGAVVVLRLLQAELVTAHLGMAMAVVACLALLTVRSSRLRAPRARKLPRDLRLARSSLLVAALCYVQLLIGAHVSGIGAGLVYRDFPLMGGAVIPAITGEREAFHAAHRVFASALVLAVVLLVVQARRERAQRRAMGTWGEDERWLVGLPGLALVMVVGQVVLGAANLYTGLSWTTVIPHLAVASWIWTTLVFQTILAYRYAPARGGSVAPGTADRPQEVRA